MPRFGLCCMFKEQPIKFRTTTATSIGKMDRSKALEKIDNLCMQNAESLMLALQFCNQNGIGSFRVNSQILPIKTHPEYGYAIKDLPNGNVIVNQFIKCGEFAKQNDIRTCFHPDQFVVLNSPKEDVVKASIRELEYQAEVSEWINADVINIHGGGVYGNKTEALKDFIQNFKSLSQSVKDRLTIENDDKSYTPEDLLPVCHKINIPLVYDVHHHRCNKDIYSLKEATEKAKETWNREPLFHISSPIDGWQGRKPERHHDFIDFKDFPECWNVSNLTVEIEAKAKEIAVLQIRKQLSYECY